MTRPDPRAADLPTRLGKGMMIGAWAAGLGLLWFLFHGVIEGERNPNRHPEAEVGAGGALQLVLERNRAGHYLADGRIDGHRVTFLLDTGATMVALSLELARRLDLPLRPGGQVRTANGVVSTWSTVLRSVDVGGLEVSDVRALVLPNLPGDEVLLGMNYLKHFEILQRGEALTLRRIVD
ncbi:retropepsin-like aspartic protease family protein [Thiococcus pfennigii]|jgi:aspartyl protease family protein|uniref:retropepsin-like aspartic protease family protein n=1 Tax=Thiococcus pfennigii TaxID=1057 RepID=UPI001905CF29|nr:retropepsin-like aspartic protease [Thiococcus pfennigii]MBK1731433.1 TIGR02281 family clan AA aspartic protease [Thiococcus pfennigii]